MMIAIALFCFLGVVTAGIIPHHSEDDGSYGHGHHYPQATSYQHVKIENYHPVPVYIKKEHSHLLEHPIAKGHTSTSVQVHHGGHHGGHGGHGGHEYHDPGYAIVSGTHQEQYHHHLGEHEEGLSEHHDGGAGLGHYGGGEELSGHGYQDYGGHQELDYGHGQEAVEYGHEATGYEQIEDGHHHLQYHH